MGQQTFELQAPGWLEPAGRRLRRIVDRSPQMRSLLLGVASASGTVLLVSPAVVLVGAAASFVYLVGGARGPLVWLLIGTVAVGGLVAGLLTAQLLRLRPAQPDGVELTREQQPALFELLDRRTIHFRTDPIDRVILRGDTQLKLVTTPRLALPLLHRRTLCIGAPLLMFLSDGQFRLALAGCIGTHTLGRRGVSAWILQSLQDWPTILGVLEHDTELVSRVLLPGVRRIANVAAFLGYEANCEIQQAQARWVLDNADERAAIEFVASQVVAQSFLDNRYWPMIHRAARHSPSPVIRPFTHLPVLLPRLAQDEQCRRWLLRAQAGVSPHRSEFRDLLAGLNLDLLDWPGLPEASAFDKLFRGREVLSRLDKHWQQSVAESWRRRHERFQQDRKRFEGLHRRATTDTLHGASAYRYVKLAKRFLKRADAVAAYVCVYRCNLDDAEMCMLCGRELLAADCPAEGARALQRACEIQPELADQIEALIRNQQLTQPGHGDAMRRHG